MDNNYKYSSMHVEDCNLENVIKTVPNAIVATLDCFFFAKKADGYTVARSQQLRESTNVLTAYDL